MPPSQPSQSLLPPSMPFQNHQYPYNQTGPPLPPTQLPIANQLQQVSTKSLIIIVSKKIVLICIIRPM